MQVDKYQNEVNEIRQEMLDAQKKLNDEQVLEKKIRDEIQQKTALLYDQKVDELRMEFEEKFNLEVQKIESKSQMINTTPHVIPTPSKIDVGYTYAQHPVFPEKKIKIPVFNPLQTNVISNRDESDSDEETTYNQKMN